MLTQILAHARDVVLSLLALAVVVAAVPGNPLVKWLDAWIARRVSHRFDKELENYRHKLTLEAEQVRARYQRELHNLGIVAERRHEVARELYRLVFIADGAVGRLFGAREVPAFEEFTRDEVAQYMDQRRIGARAKEKVLDAWEEDRNEAVRKLRDADRVVEIAEASEAYRTAWNYFLTNSLYLPDEVTDLCRQIFDPLWEILGAAKFPRGPRGRDITALQRQSTERIWQLRARLQALLGVRVDEKSPPELPAA
jgi:hypothetical protein